MNNLLKNITSFSNEVTITIPSTTGVSTPVSDETHQSIARQIQQKMAIIFGGCTTTRAEGGWVSSTGEYISEKVTLCTSAAPAKQFYIKLQSVIHLARELCRQMQQECIAVKINGNMYFIN